MCFKKQMILHHAAAWFKMFRESREGKGTATNAEEEKCYINTTDVEK